MADGLKSLTWDGATCTKILLGTTTVPVQKITLPESTITVEKIRSTGQMRARKRTPGVAEHADLTLVILATYYESIILPRMPLHAGTELEFVVTTTIIHPSVEGSLAVMADQCRIVKVKRPDFEADEKGLLYELGVSTMAVFDKGRDNKWKSIDRDDTKPSAIARAAMTF